jgi:hypothetical protein
VLLDIQLQALTLPELGHVGAFGALGDRPFTAFVVDEVGHSKTRHDGINGGIDTDVRRETMGHGAFLLG